MTYGLILRLGSTENNYFLLSLRREGVTMSGFCQINRISMSTFTTESSTASNRLSTARRRAARRFDTNKVKAKNTTSKVYAAMAECKGKRKGDWGCML